MNRKRLLPNKEAVVVDDFDPMNHEIGPWESFGADTLLKGQPMDCMAIANGPVVCYVLTREDMNILYLNEHNPIFQSKPSSDDVKGDFDIEGIIQHPNKDCDISWSSLKNLGCIGRGTFASVHMVQDKANDHRTYALKVITHLPFPLLLYISPSLSYTPAFFDDALLSLFFDDSYYIYIFLFGYISLVLKGCESYSNEKHAPKEKIRVRNMEFNC